MALVVKNQPVNTGDIREANSIHGSGRSPGGGYGLDNPMGRGAWQATVHGVAESDTTEQLTHTQAPYELMGSTHAKQI